MTVMTGIKAAQIRMCHRCQYRCTRNALFADWPDCQGGPGGRDNPLELSSDFMEGPPTNCPQGLWTGLTQIDVEGAAAASKAQSIERDAAKWQQLLDILSPDETTAADIRAKIEQLVKADIIRSPETAAALEEYVDKR